MASRNTSNATLPSGRSSFWQMPGCNVPNEASTVFGPWRSVPLWPGMIEGRTARARRHRIQRHAEGGQHGQRVGLGVHRIIKARGAEGGKRREADAQAGRDQRLRGIGGVGRADLEQAEIAKAARHVAGGGQHQRRHRGVAHLVEIGGDRVGQAQRLRRIAEQGGGLMIEEAEGHAFQQAARRQNPAGERRARLFGRQHRGGNDGVDRQ